MPSQMIINNATIWKGWGKCCVLGLLGGLQYPTEELIWTIAMNRRDTPSTGTNTVSLQDRIEMRPDVGIRMVESPPDAAILQPFGDFVWHAVL